MANDPCLQPYHLAHLTFYENAIALGMRAGSVPDLLVYDSGANSDELKRAPTTATAR